MSANKTTSTTNQYFFFHELRLIKEKRGKTIQNNLNKQIELTKDLQGGLAKIEEENNVIKDQIDNINILENSITNTDETEKNINEQVDFNAGDTQGLAASASAATYGLNVNFIDTSLANAGTAFSASVSSSALTEQTKSALTKSIANSLRSEAPISSIKGVNISTSCSVPIWFINRL